ncbi:hypothetical protein DF156_19250 [Burkholderia ubonensis]|nr:hypothetical protein CJO66_12800 [Burkholderia ubonensis]RQP38516.1 hypothetical protein DF156_19250 [Burkholderia ubonensis]RQP39516.1 hypothetical protein DF155_06915 [Burkholderia ubonensis]RQP39815.1 hypothetical protein DF154_14690 [Burkholderia ubonensis]RQP52900.1 hypothetical protein DF144_17935 [Burkholderia ubonensis]
MSDLFVDTEVDYRHVAEQLVRHCPSMSDATLKEVFFTEVAPELASNGMTPAPSVWTEFDSDKVVAGISKMLKRRRTSPLYLAGNSLWRLVCRWFCGDMWRKLEHELQAARQAGV